MNDLEINIALAKAMGYEVLTFPLDGPVQNGEITVAKDNVNKRMVMVDYKDPAIFSECIGWLLDNGYSLNTSNPYMVTRKGCQWFQGENLSSDKDLFKAVALAMIEAKKD